LITDLTNYTEKWGRLSEPGSDEIKKNIKGTKEKNHVEKNVNRIINIVKENARRLLDTAMAAIHNIR
jgi:hypothetical protein